MYYMRVSKFLFKWCSDIHVNRPRDNTRKFYRDTFIVYQRTPKIKTCIYRFYVYL